MAHSYTVLRSKVPTSSTMNSAGVGPNQQQPDRPSLQEGEDAVPIMLYLMDPCGTDRVGFGVGVQSWGRMAGWLGIELR